MDADDNTELDAHAPAGKKKRFQCEHCSRLFARLEHLQRHERIRRYNPCYLLFILTGDR
jgi:predicted SAM-dependent methyltransferase